MKYLLTKALKRVIERFLGEKNNFLSDYPRIEVPKMVFSNKNFRYKWRNLYILQKLY